MPSKREDSCKLEDLSSSKLFKDIMDEYNCNKIVPIDQSYEYHNAAVPYHTMNHFVTKLCTFLFQNCALWDIGVVHCVIWEFCLLNDIFITYYRTYNSSDIKQHCSHSIYNVNYHNL